MHSKFFSPGVRGLSFVNNTNTITTPLAYPGLIIQANPAAAPTLSLFQIRDSSGTIIFSVTNNGTVTINGGVTQYTNTMAQDAVGNILIDTPTIDFTYNTAVPSISAVVKNNSILNTHIRQGAALSVIGNTTNAAANVADIAGTANQVLRVNSGGTALGFGQVNLASSAAVTGALAITNGGTGQTTANAAFNALSPMTTLGDTIYGGASGAGTRLAGNTTTTQKFLSQTGDGVNSAAPTWQPMPSPVVDTQTFTSNGTWTKPATGTFARIICIGGGGGGGSGARRGGGFTGSTGGSGGGGGAYSEIIVPIALLGATETVTVGAGGVGGTPQTSDSTDGNIGDNGGNSTFGTWVRAFGGDGGVGGQAAFSVNGGSGGLVGMWAGGNGGNSNDNTPGNLTTTILGGGGGGGGGGINNLNMSANGGLSGAVLVINHSYSAGGVAPGGVGATGIAKGNPLPGIGGGGGASGDNTTAGGAGGNGGNYGAGGGGGGASWLGQNSGAGGDGADGVVVVYVF